MHKSPGTSSNARARTVGTNVFVIRRDPTRALPGKSSNGRARTVRVNGGHILNVDGLNFE